MNHECRTVFVHDEDDLKEPTSSPWAPHKQLVLTDPPRIRTLRLPDHLLGFLGIDSMSSQVFDVPLVPAEVHEASLPPMIAQPICFFNKIFGTRVLLRFSPRAFSVVTSRPTGPVSGP
jgi:hypothetical protein